MVGKNPIVLVGTKLDLLPEGTHPRDVAGALKSVLYWLEMYPLSMHASATLTHPLLGGHGLQNG